MMDRVTAELEEVAEGGAQEVFYYLDDILVATPDEWTHRHHIQQLLDRLREFGLVLNTGAHPLEDKTAAIQCFLQPITVKEL
jgi:hypothetical protein